MKMKKYIKFLFVVLFVMIFGFQIQPDDKELFMGLSIGENIVRPNVVVLMDNSGSMSTISFYPKKGLDGLEGTADDGYDPNTSYSGYFENYSQVDRLTHTQWFGRWIYNGNAYQYNTGELENIGGKNNWTGCYAGDGTPNNFQVGSNGTSYFEEGERIMFRDTSSRYYDAVATIARKYDVSGNTWFELSDIVGGPITVNGGHFQRSPDGQNRVPVVVQLYGISDLGYSTRYPQNYVEWLYIHATPAQQEAVSHFSTWGTFDVSQQPAPVLSNCATPGNDDINGSHPRIQQLFTRIQIAREVICRVASESNQIVKLGLFKFTYSNGSTMEEGLTDMSDESSELVAYKNNVWDIAASTWTPLGEALADVWYYYKPGPNSKTYWPVDYEIEHDTVNHSISNPVTPIDYWCQNNYVVVMTDGESTQDRFDDWGKYGNSIFKNKPVKRASPWNSWNDGWGDPDNNDQSSGIPSGYNPNSTYCPNYTCWDTGHGSDYLDDVAYFLRHQDMFPDDHFGNDPVSGWPGDQNIYTYTIGFNADNHMLLQTAINGDGAYYTATNYDELVEAFQLVITSINLRNFAFSSITAPKKTATATNDELTVSYVGYFMPSQAASIWEGHLLAFRLIDSWGFDTDNSGEVEPEEFVYDSQEKCLEASDGLDCKRWVALPVGHEWDAADKIPIDRDLYTHNNSTTLIDFTTTNRDTLMPLFGAATTEAEAEQIITKIRTPQLSDIFHSDVGFVGAPPPGKQFISNLNPTGTGDQNFAEFYTSNQNRTKVLYTGTNDGILHMFYGDGLNAGKEVWGFIPDEVLPSLKSIVIDSQHTYTVDGRLSANDIYYVKSGQSFNTWSTILTFGLRRGGNAYYTLDVTTVGSQPSLLWKFKEDTYSGQSWGKPVLGRIKIQDPDNPSEIIDKWVAVLAGGLEFNSENPTDQRGKSIFVVDASNGELLWMIGYHPTDGAEDLDNSPDPEKVEVTSFDNIRHLTRSELFNFSIPSSLTAVDKDNDGFMDTIYFGNVGGHLFKTDISSNDTDDWTTSVLYKTNITTLASTYITAINGSEITVNDKVFTAGWGIQGLSSYATGYITEIDNKVLTVTTTSGTFQDGETIVTRSYDPIYLSPAVAYDTCYQLWVFFGTGDRDRPRTNPNQGRFIALKDTSYTNSELSDLSQLSWEDSDGDSVVDTLTKDESSLRGWYFDFPDGGEKIFDPEPIVLPDEYVIPHIYFNTYQPPGVSQVSVDNPCAAPDEGTMILYDLYLSTCGTVDTIEGERATGRIAGGGIYEGKEYVMYKSETGDVADVPGEEGGNFIAEPIRLPYPGGLAFWKEKKR